MMPNRRGPALSVVTVLLVGLFAGTCAAALAAPVSGAHDGCITLKSEQLGSPKTVLAGLWAARVEPGVLPPRLSPTGCRYFDPDPDLLTPDPGSDRSSRAPPKFL